MLGLSRVLLVGLAAVLVIGGVVAIASGDPGGLIAGLALIAGAVPVAIGAAYEMRRYRSAAERDRPSPSGPGGTPPDEPLEARFRATGEVFVDPTSGRRMRVFVDPDTGERRYRAEG